MICQVHWTNFGLCLYQLKHDLNVKKMYRKSWLVQATGLFSTTSGSIPLFSIPTAAFAMCLLWSLILTTRPATRQMRRKQPMEAPIATPVTWGLPSAWGALSVIRNSLLKAHLNGSENLNFSNLTQTYMEWNLTILIVWTAGIPVCICIFMCNWKNSKLSFNLDKENCRGKYFDQLFDFQWIPAACLNLSYNSPL